LALEVTFWGLVTVMAPVVPTFEDEVEPATSTTLLGVPTEIVTDEGELTSVLLATTKEKTSVCDDAGALKVGCIALALDSVTVGPAVWVHEYVSDRSFGSELFEPSSLTDEPKPTTWFDPAEAMGISIAGADPTMYWRSNQGPYAVDAHDASLEQVSES
jgi:hypothetical protein